MSDEEEHHPGDRAPAMAHYEELNVFGTQTGAVVHVREGMANARSVLPRSGRPPYSLGPEA